MLEKHEKWSRRPIVLQDLLLISMRKSVELFSRVLALWPCGGPFFHFSATCLGFFAKALAPPLGGNSG